MSNYGIDASKLQQRLQEILLEDISKLDAANAITMTEDMELSSTEVSTRAHHPTSRPLVPCKDHETR